MAGHTFVGRDDRTHLRLSRAHPFSCRVRDTAGERRLEGHDRGFRVSVTGTGGKPLELMLLKAELPANTGPGLAERLRLSLHAPRQARPATVAEVAATADRIELRSDGVEAACVRSGAFTMPMGP